MERLEGIIIDIMMHVHTDVVFMSCSQGLLVEAVSQGGDGIELSRQSLQLAS